MTNKIDEHYEVYLKHEILKEIESKERNKRKQGNWFKKRNPKLILLQGGKKDKPRRV